MKKKLLTAVFALIIYICPAQWTNIVSQNTLVRDSTSIAEATPMMVTIADGSTYISWFEPHAGINYELRMQRLDKNGNKLWGNSGLLVDNQQQNTALFRYDLMADHEGNAIVAFQDERTGHLDIVIYKVDTSGNLIWSQNGITLSAPNSTQGLAPNIGITGDNNVIVAWTATGNSNKWIACQKISSAGTILWPSALEIIDQANVKHYSRPTIAPSGGDDFVMLYVEESGPGLPPGKMLAQHFDGNGFAVWLNATVVSTYTIPFFFFPKAVSDNNSGFYVSFNTSLPSAPTTGVVYLQHVSSSGVIWNATGNPASLLAGGHLFSAGTIFDSSNNVIYTLLKATDSNQGQSGVYVQKLDTGGNMLWTSNGEEVIPIQSAYNDPSGISVTPTGIIISYTIGSTSNLLLNAFKIDASGSDLWGGIPVTLCSLNTGKDDIGQGIFANDEVVVVWEDSRMGGGIYAQNIRDNGSIGLITGIDQLKEKSKAFRIYPNPSGELNIYINSLTGNTSELTISDLTGRMVFSRLLEFNGISENIKIENNLSKGIYIVDLNAQGNHSQQKWMKD